MPNWAFTKLQFSHQEDFNAIIEKFTTHYEEDDKREIDFDKVIPMPPSFNIIEGSITSYAKDYIKGNCSLESICDQYDLSDEPMREEWKKVYNDGCSLNPKSKEEFLQFVDVIKYNMRNYGHTTWYFWAIDNWGTKWNACETSIDSSNMIIRWKTAWDWSEKIINEMFIQHELVGKVYCSFTEEQMTLWGGEQLWGPQGLIERKSYEEPCEDFFKIVAEQFDPEQEFIQWNGSNFIYVSKDYTSNPQPYDPTRVFDDLTTTLSKKLFD